MRKDSIKEISNVIENQLIDLDKSIEEEKVNRVLVKNILENLRSILDYIAGDISEKLINPRNRIYFPYSDDLVNFNKSIKKNLPNLEVEFPQIYSLIKSIQPFENSSDWLILICGLVNTAKHNNLNEMERKELYNGIEAYGLLKIAGSKNISIKNSSAPGYNIVSLIIEDGELKELIMDDFSKLTFQTYSKVTFLGQEHEINKFLKFCHSNINKLTNEIYAIIG